MTVHVRKPAAPVWLHLLLAALMWSVVGTVLLALGVVWALEWHSPWLAAVLIVAVLAGALKGRFVLARAARRTVARDVARGDGACLGGFVSWKTWLLVLVMIALGRWLRSGVLPRWAVGFVYAGIGTALLVGCATLWRGWARSRRERRPVT